MTSTPTLPPFVLRLLENRKVEIRPNPDFSNKHYSSNANQSTLGQSIETLIQARTYQNICRSYQNFLDVTFQAPMILQLDFQQFIFPFYIHLAAQLYQLQKCEDAKNFIEKYRSIQPVQCKDMILEMLEKGDKYKPPHFEIQMNQIALEDLMRIIESRKQVLLSFIITTQINIVLGPFNHPLLYVENSSSSVKPILEPLDYSKINLRPLSVLLDPESKMPPSISQKDNNVYLTQALPDITHIIAYNHNNKISTMQVSKCARLMVVGKDSNVVVTPLDYTIRSFSVNPNTTLISHAGKVLSVDISRDSRLTVSGGMDCQLRVAHIEAFKPISHYKLHIEPVLNVAWDNSSQYFLGTSQDRTISMWSLRCPNVLRLFIGHTLPVSKAIFSKDSKSIISCSNDLTMRIWDVGTGQQKAKFNCGRSPPIALDVSPCNEFIACGCENGSVILWKSDVGEKVWVSSEQFHSSPISDVKFSNDGSILLASSISGKICAWDVKALNPECIFQSETTASTIDSITITNQNLVCTSGRSTRGGILI